MISVVIPAFNEEEYINECLESLAAQDYSGDYEVLVVNNSCTDNTDSIARSQGVRVINCPEKGVVIARQKGSDEAKGDIIVQADADTIYPADWLSRIDSHFSKDGDTSAVAGFFLYYQSPSWAWIEYALRRVANNFVGLPFFKQPLFVSGANFAFRRESFITVNGYDRKSFYPDQWGICRALKCTGKIKYDPSIIVYTSSRRVNKPFIRFFLDALKNLFNVIKVIFITAAKKVASIFNR